MKRIYVIIIIALFFCSCEILFDSDLSSKEVQTLEYLSEAENANYSFVYKNMDNSPDLVTLKTLYSLDSVVDSQNPEFENILHLLKWTNGRFRHDGSNKPSQPNTLTILKEASEGRRFTCVEFATVLRTVLASHDFKARVVGLMTKDVETTRYGAGHVLTEVWSTQYNKWFLLDPQFNIVPVLDNVPLNAVEFQNAIAQKSDFQLMDVNGRVSRKRERSYLSFITPYLYYIDTRFDQREVHFDSLLFVNGKVGLMLVPVGAKNPTVFQRNTPINRAEYTNNINDFYRKP
jgi:hypothetical protein